jgi:hypothetical protein
MVRITKAKFMHGKRPLSKTWTDAIRMLFEDHLLCPAMQSPEFTLDRNVFRRERLYKLVSGHSRAKQFQLRSDLLKRRVFYPLAYAAPYMS